MQTTESESRFYTVTEKWMQIINKLFAQSTKIKNTGLTSTWDMTSTCTY